MNVIKEKAREFCRCFHSQFLSKRGKKFSVTQDFPSIFGTLIVYNYVLGWDYLASFKKLHNIRRSRAYAFLYFLCLIPYMKGLIIEFIAISCEKII